MILLHREGLMLGELVWRSVDQAFPCLQQSSQLMLSYDDHGLLLVIWFHSFAPGHY
jgi:hypothetical protein